MTKTLTLPALDGVVLPPETVTKHEDGCPGGHRCDCNYVQTHYDKEGRVSSYTIWIKWKSEPPIIDHDNPQPKPPRGILLK